MLSHTAAQTDTGLPDPPPGGVPVTMYALPGYADLYPDEDVQVGQFDVYLGGVMDRQLIDATMRDIAPQLTGHELLAYVVWELPSPFEFQIPARVCVPGTDWCWDVPGGGSQIELVHQYRVWFMTRALVGASYATRAAVMPALTLTELIGQVVLAFVGMFAIVSAFGLLSGQLKARDVMDRLEALFGKMTPGENIEKGLTWPLVAFGLVVVAAGIFLPKLVGPSVSVGGHVPVGKGGRLSGSIRT